MTNRDRLVAIGLGAVVILAAFWFLVVSPERKQATELDQQVASAQQTLSSAQSRLASARTAEAAYQADYAAVVRMGESVPPTPEVPSLVYELDQLSKQKSVEFNSVSSSSAGSGSTTASAATTAAASTPAAFTALPFTFIFKGSFFDLYKLLHRLDGLAAQTQKGVEISGRLLTIQGASLTGGGTSGATSGTETKGKKEELTGSVTATAYVLPSSQGLTAGATPAGPAGAGVAGTAQPASTSGGSTSAPPATISGVTP